MGVLAFAVTKIIASARAVGKERGPGTETAFMTSAMEQALDRVREQERAMKARAEASERLSEEIIASITSGLLVVTGERLVRTLNPAGRRILGVPELRSLRTGATAVDPPMSDLLRTAAPLAAVVEECLATGRPILRRAVQMGHPAGAAVHLGVTVSPIADGGGGAQGAICLFTDLSAVVELEEQLRLKDSLARLGELTAGIAHEFRNGLATIHGYGRLLDLERVPEDFRPYVQGIRDETEALRQVVINFLNFAKPAELALDAGRPARHRRTGGRGNPRRRGVAWRRGASDGRIRHRAGRRGAAAPGLQQSVPQRGRSLRRCRGSRRAWRSRARSTRHSGRRS